MLNGGNDQDGDWRDLIDRVDEIWWPGHVTVAAQVSLATASARDGRIVKTSSSPPISNSSRTWPPKLQRTNFAALRSAWSVATSSARNAALVRYKTAPKSTTMD